MSPAGNEPFVVFNALIRGIRDGRVTAADCRLLVAVCIVQLLALAAVARVPIPAARRALVRIRRSALALRGAASEARVIWAIEATGRWRVGGSSCLARALAAELLLPPAVQPPTVVVGVTSLAGGRLKSHAWIERDGRVLIGGGESRREYLPLVTWSGGTA
jgi:hypothetical protein